MTDDEQDKARLAEIDARVAEIMAERSRLAEERQPLLARIKRRARERADAVRAAAIATDTGHMKSADEIGDYALGEYGKGVPWRDIPLPKLTRRKRLIRDAAFRALRNPRSVLFEAAVKFCTEWHTWPESPIIDLRDATDEEVARLQRVFEGAGYVVTRQRGKD